jgi:serine/threonine protein kinase
MATIKDYRVVCKVGEGTFGEVFKAVHLRTGKVVALKKVRIRKLTEGIPTALLREIQSLEQIQHNNVLALYEYFPSGSSVVICCELMTSDLYQIMKCLGSLGRVLQATEVCVVSCVSVCEVVSVRHTLCTRFLLTYRRTHTHTHMNAQIKSVMKMILQGLAAVHEGKLIHRDLKPANVLFSSRCAMYASVYVCVCDLGVCVLHTSYHLSLSVCVCVCTAGA